MILDELASFEQYAQADRRLMPAWEFLKTHPLVLLENGRYELGGNAYAVVKDMPLRSEAPFEAHRRYIDVQLVVNGEEIIEYIPMQLLTDNENYSEERDLQLFEDRPERTVCLKLGSGSFCIFYPQDAHKPAMCWREEANRRMLIKIPV